MTGNAASYSLLVIGSVRKKEPSSFAITGSFFKNTRARLRPAVAGLRRSRRGRAGSLILFSQVSVAIDDAGRVIAGRIKPVSGIPATVVSQIIMAAIE